MKRRIFITLALVCCILFCFAFAAGIAGKWTGTLKAPDGNDFQLTYTFKTDSGKLTGVVSSQIGDITIIDGKLISPTDFSFTVPTGGMNIKNTGKYYADADSIGLDIEFNGRKSHTTLKRATEK